MCLDGLPERTRDVSATTPIRAWKVFQTYTHGRLLPQVFCKATVYECGGMYEAVDVSDQNHYREISTRNLIGFYAYRDKQEARKIAKWDVNGIALPVYLYGVVIEYQNGYRSQYMKIPRSLWWRVALNRVFGRRRK